MTEDSIIKKEMELYHLQQQINIGKPYWTNNKGTNCLAYAIGLDVPAKSICTGAYAYNGGILYQTFTPQPKDISHLTTQEKIELDWKTLEIYYEEIDYSDKLFDPEEWKVAYFIDPQNTNDFHFLRKTNDDAWHHKPGRFEIPTFFDDQRHIIRNPKEAYFEYPAYVYNKCYRLSKKREIRNKW